MWCVRWYLRYPISVAQMGEMTRERGLAISPSCVWRWVQTYGPAALVQLRSVRLDL
jgi:transposase, IS6 family